jgi:hypothetical protein
LELAELLLEKELIFSEDLERIFGKRKADQVKEAKEAEEALSKEVVDKKKTESPVAEAEAAPKKARKGKTPGPEKESGEPGIIDFNK